MTSRRKTEDCSFNEFLHQGNFLVCKGCRDVILDRIICKIQKQTWHSRCLKCAKCDVQLNDNLCFYEKGKIFCSNYCAKTKILCRGCEVEISQTELTRIINGKYTYHINCFSCVKCCKQLYTGDMFYFTKDSKVICNNDCEDSESKEDNNGNIIEQLCSKKCKTKFDESQRQLMETTYKINSYPTRTTLQSLSQTIGFNVRAIDVWFQNRRAKDRRMKKSSAVTLMMS